MAPADVGLGRLGLVRFRLAPLQLGFVQPGLQLLHRLGAVLVLAALVLALDDDVGRQVGDANRAVGGVDVLPAGPARPVGVDLELALVDLDVDVVVDLGIDPHRGEAGVAPRRAVERADPDQPVHPAFGLGIAIGVLALDQQRRRLDPRLLAGMVVDQLDLHAVPLGPAGIHPLQHAGPVLALGPAGPGIDLDVAVVGVRLAGEQRGDLVALGPLGQLGQRPSAVVDQRVVALRLGHLDQLDGVGQLALDLARRPDRLVQPAPLAHHFLRRLGIVPQARLLDPGVQFLQPAQRPVPVEEAAQQRGRGIDLVDMGLRFGAHRTDSVSWFRPA